MKLGASGLELRVGGRGSASEDDVVGNPLAGVLPSGFTGRGRLQADFLHLRGPLPVKVRTAMRCNLISTYPKVKNLPANSCLQQMTAKRLKTKAIGR